MLERPPSGSACFPMVCLRSLSPHEPAQLNPTATDAASEARSTRQYNRTAFRVRFCGLKNHVTEHVEGIFFRLSIFVLLHLISATLPSSSMCDFMILPFLEYALDLPNGDSI